MIKIPVAGKFDWRVKLYHSDKIVVMVLYAIGLKTKIMVDLM
jgi:hypothetical protein